MNNSLKAIRGDDLVLSFTITDSDDVAINITGYTIFFTVKKNVSDADADAVLSGSQATHFDAAGGRSTITISSATTDDIAPGEYYWDMQVKYPDGRIHSSYPGNFTMVGDITLRTT